MKQQRMTIQKKMVYDAVCSLTCHPTAEQVYLCVKSAHPSISKGTVYRNLSALAENGQILKIEIANGADRFDFQTKSHYHMRCDKCGSVDDVYMDYDETLDERASQCAGCTIYGHTILFRGVCAHCMAQVEPGEPIGKRDSD